MGGIQIMKTRAVATVMLVLAGLLVTGCGGTVSTNDDAQASQNRHATLDKLHNRPSLEDTEQHLHDTVQRIIAAINDVTPGLKWHSQGDRDQGPCGGEYSNTDGQDVYLPHMVSDTPIPDANWPRALQAARNVAREAGITEIDVFKDQPGDHEVNLYGSNGNTIQFGSVQAVALFGGTGCRLPRNPAG